MRAGEQMRIISFIVYIFLCNTFAFGTDKNPEILCDATSQSKGTLPLATEVVQNPIPWSLNNSMVKPVTPVKSDIDNQLFFQLLTWAPKEIKIINTKDKLFLK